MQKAVNVKPAYKEPWFWMVCGPLIFIIIWGVLVVIFAYQVADDRVVDNYYKEGRMINKTFDEQKKAAALDVKGRIDIAADHSTLWVDLHIKTQPQKLTLSFSHPSDAQKDFSLELKKTMGGRFMASLPEHFSGQWYVLVEGQQASGNEQWKVSSSINTAVSRRSEFQAHL
jgi:uncharacterized protein